LVHEDAVAVAIQPSPADLGNQVLYKLCTQHFYHREPASILAKTKLIGKAYSVALDRVKVKRHTSHDFYTTKVVPAFMRSRLDTLTLALRSKRRIRDSHVSAILKLHLYLMKLITPLTQQNKRSFSSKYLHFHLPYLFFLYDTRALYGLAQFGIRLPKDFRMPGPRSADPAYAKFFHKCVILQQVIQSTYDITLNPRQLDNLLLDIANRALKTEQRNKNRARSRTLGV